MADLFLFLLLLSIAAFVVALIKPTVFSFLLKNYATRKRGSIIFGIAVVVFFVSFGVSTDTSSKPVEVTGQTAQQERIKESDSNSEEEPKLKTDERLSSTEKEARAQNNESDDNDSLDSLSVSGEMSVYFFDVGQADSTLLKGPDFTILIDAGDWRRSDVVPLLRFVGVTEIDLLIGTHPHADHIGQFPEVIEEFTIDEVWLSGDEHTSQTFERAIDAILASNAKYHEPRTGENHRIGSLKLEILNPSTLTGDFHEGSIGIRAVYGDVSFVFTGDAESHTEKKIVESNNNLRAQILQLGHHGSKTSSTQIFLNAVSPEVSIYSASEGSQYGHPHDEVVSRIKGMGIDLYGTNAHGTITVTTDGSTYSISTEKTGSVVVTEPIISEPSESEETTTVTSGSCGTGQVDINSGSFEELKEIIHIGDSRAQELISLRPFSSVDSMTRISGIGSARVSDIKEQNIACVN